MNVCISFWYTGTSSGRSERITVSGSLVIEFFSDKWLSEIQNFCLEVSISWCLEMFSGICEQINCDGPWQLEMFFVGCELITVMTPDIERCFLWSVSSSTGDGWSTPSDSWVFWQRWVTILPYSKLPAIRNAVRRLTPLVWGWLGRELRMGRTLRTRSRRLPSPRRRLELPPGDLGASEYVSDDGKDVLYIPN